MLLQCLSAIHDVEGKETFGIIELHDIAERGAGISSRRVRKEAIKSLINQGYLIYKKGALWSFVPSGTKSYVSESNPIRVAKGLERAVKMVSKLSREARRTEGMQDVSVRLEGVIEDLESVIEDVRGGKKVAEGGV